MSLHDEREMHVTPDAALNRRSFLARGAAVAAVPAVAALTGGALAEPASADALPTYAPIPPSALGPAVNAQGYYAGQVEKNLYWVTDGTYQSAFLTTRAGVVLFDAPPTIGHNLQRAIDGIAAATHVSNKVTHIVYTHHHADHVGASSLFGSDVTRVAHAETKRLLARDNDPAAPVPLPDVTFDTRRTLHVGGERVELAWHGTNHTPDNIYVHFPDHDTLMLVDILLPGWAPYDSFNVNEDVPGSIAAAAKAMTYPWKHFIGGHMGRLGTRDDMVVYQQYVSDLIDNIKLAVTAVDPTPFFAPYGNNSWAAVKAYQDAQVAYASAPVIAKYAGVLAAVDVYTPSTTFILLESIRLDQGFGSQNHP
jgi:glyoxylase-like metal-dependent hydrolase (beta-lactamase superfamily II)